MEKETILYSLTYVDKAARTIIPELDKAWNMTPHRFDKAGETVSIDIKKTIDPVNGYCAAKYVNVDVTDNKINITLEPNNNIATRQARVLIYLEEPGNNMHKLLQFIIHLN